MSRRPCPYHRDGHLCRRHHGPWEVIGFEDLPPGKSDRRSHQINRYAKSLRNWTPKAEQWFQALWNASGMLIKADHFNKRVGQYIPDLHNRKWGYVVEVDEPYHETEKQKARDKKRSEFFQRIGFVVFRVKAYDAEAARLAIEGIKLHKSRPRRNLTNFIKSYLRAYAKGATLSFELWCKRPQLKEEARKKRVGRFLARHPEKAAAQPLPQQPSKRRGVARCWCHLNKETCALHRHPEVPLTKQQVKKNARKRYTARKKWRALKQRVGEKAQLNPAVFTPKVIVRKKSD